MLESGLCTHPMRATASEAEGSHGHLGGQAEGLAVGPSAADALWPGASPLPTSVCFPIPPPGSSVLPSVRSAAQVPLRYCPALPTRVPAGLPNASLGSPHKDAACSLLKSKHKTSPARDCGQVVSCPEAGG